ncbi:cytochrome o ubiquinol oxidase subunit III [Legionella waltersii]|uniref:Cytochrome bo(3) ubiquinol oxidase subunit 3 n=1 Tax=Legionella waltersii TaxID=66969 RepID=A0A0W1ABP9_9GAMM|nr:cytochrome o ubiquinol oxidase subunit III [Legionella waltersii]KTD78773.1 cytochrome o ubiquinol oxidase subunit III cyoC [Legionella waltersii]SNV11215.1 cytochrome o ubiquinol oxidase subunit III cyoC [Legionella waltersii]
MHNEAIHTDIHHHDSDSTDVFGFWMYILTDCILFGCLFATFLVLNNPGYPGPALKNYVNLHDVLIETFLLLISNFTFCLAILNVYQDKQHKVQLWLGITFLLGAGFISMEVSEFIHMANEGFRWDVSGAISSFFTLVGTHGLHVGFGLLWILIMIVQLPLIQLNHVKRRRMTYLGLFWNFLDIVWIFVFTIVYLMGAT